MVELNDPDFADKFVKASPTAIIDAYGRKRVLTKMFYKKLPPFDDEFEKTYKEWKKLRMERLAWKN